MTVSPALARQTISIATRLYLKTEKNFAIRLEATGPGLIDWGLESAGLICFKGMTYFQEVKRSGGACTTLFKEDAVQPSATITWSASE